MSNCEETYQRAVQQSPKLFAKRNPYTLAKRPLRRRRTSWYDLPYEILLEIAQYCTIPTCEDTHRVQRNPALYDIDISFSRVNHACRKAFFECIGKHHVVAQFRLCKGPERPFVERALEDSLLRLLNCRNTQKLLMRLVTADMHKSMSFIRIDMEQQKGYSEVAAAEVLVLLEKENTLLLREVMQSHVPEFPFLEVACWCGGHSSSRLLEDAVYELMSSLRGVKLGALKAERPFHLQRRLRSHFAKTSKPIFEETQVEELLIKEKLNALQQQRVPEEIEPPELQIMVLWMILQRHIQSLAESRIPLLHVSIRLLEHFQKSLAYWLFSKPNDQKIQSRFLLEEEGDRYQIVKLWLGWCATFRTHVRYLKLKQIDDWVYFGDLVRLLVSYAALELALARALLSGDHTLSHITSPLEARLRREPLFLHSARSISMNYALSVGDTLDVLRRVRDTLYDHRDFLETINYEHFLSWLSEAENYSDHIRTAYVQNRVLVYPMQQLARAGRL